MEIKNFKELEQEIGTKRVLVFGGFSGLGYEKPNELIEQIKKRIECEISLVGKDNVVLVSGATSDGIGACYEVAKNNGVLIYYGGGDVAVAELKEAIQKNINIEVDSSFMPNPSNVKKKQEKNPQFYPTPVVKFMVQQKSLEGNVSNKLKIS